VAQPQTSEIEATYSRKLTKEDSIINWQKPAENIEREIRAFIEWPKSRATIANREVIITKAHVLDLSGQAGTFAIIEKQLVAYCGDKALVIDALKPAGKQEMTGQSFLAGYKQFL
jgi:methionyl-tRNA formyltransferase